MLHEVMLGVSVDVQVGANLESYVVKAGALVYSLQSELVSSLSLKARTCLRALGLVHKSCDAPLFIEIDNFDIIPTIFSTFSETGGNLSRVILYGAELNRRNVDNWIQVLLTYPCCLCIDSFGDVLRPLLKPPPPQDHELVQILHLMITSGVPSSQLMLSVSMKYRIQLTQYGGPGYAHILSNVVPLLIDSGCTCETVHALVAGNMLRVLSWYTPPEAVVLPVLTFQCSWCSHVIEAGKQFEKLTFVYCSPACISNHRRAGWKPAQS